ncbi:MAG: glycosyltransferase family 39 protein [Myxococcaceae bacterium]
MKRHLGPLITFAVCALVFWPVTNGGFLDVDDGALVLRNPHVNTGLSWENVKWAFTSSYFASYHPLTWLSHQVDVSIFGLHPPGHHLSSLLLFALSAALLCAFWQRAGGDPVSGAVATLLWALHPLRVEPVAWVAARKDVLSGLFVAVALLLYLHYSRQRTLGRWLLVTVAVAAAMLSKVTAVVLPALLFLADVWPLKTMEGLRARLIEKAPWVLISVWCAYRTYQAHLEAEALPPLAVGERISNVLSSYGLSLLHTVYPSQLSYLYPRGAPSGLAVAAAAVALIALLAAAFVLRRRQPSISFGILWFLVALLPSAGWVPFGGALTADRFSHVAAMGLAGGLVFALPSGVSRRTSGLLVAGMAAVLLAMVASDLFEETTWRDSKSIFDQALERDPDNAMALHSLALLQTQTGELDDGLLTFQKLLTLTPNDGFVLSNYARALLRKGDLPGALDAATRGYQRRPNDPLVRDALIQTLIAAGKCPDPSGCGDVLRQISSGE